MKVEAFFEHPQQYRLIWSDLDISALKEKGQHQATLKLNGKEVRQLWLDADSEVFIPDRTPEVELSCPAGIIFHGHSNLAELTDICHLNFQSIPQAPQLGLAPCISTERAFQVRGTLTPTHQVEEQLRALAQKQGLSSTGHLIGGLQFKENGKPGPLQRLWGYALEIDQSLIAEIQRVDLHEKAPKEPSKYRLELQLTSAHRECYHRRLIEKESTGFSPILSFTDPEIQEAQKNLFAFDPLVRWEESFIELVAFFDHQGHWQEMARQPAWLHRWEHCPASDCEEVQADWVVWDLKTKSSPQSILTSPIAYRDHFPPKLVLKPFSDRLILAWWDLEQKEVEKAIQDAWGCDLSEVGFYIKMHEEYLGTRKPRPDLEAHIIEVFNSWQNIYLTCQGDQCYSAEIVVRHFDRELALTPVSGPIVTPKGEGDFPSEAAPFRNLASHWQHPTQREVCHSQGKDSDNAAKVLFHLHMHSPNLFRAEQFRGLEHIKLFKTPLVQQHIQPIPGRHPA